MISKDFLIFSQAVNSGSETLDNSLFPSAED